RLLERTLACYDEALLREVAARLVRPRNQWPVEDLREKIGQTAANPAVLDRRIKGLDPVPRQLLALIGRSRQPILKPGYLVELLFCPGLAVDLSPVFTLLEEGLLSPAVVDPNAPEVPGPRVKTFQQWLGFPGPGGLVLFTTPLIASRALGEDLGLPE